MLHFFGTKQRKIDTKVQSNSSVMLKRGTWNFKKNAKRPFLWQRSAGNQDRCSDHFLRTLIFKLEGWKVFDNNGLGVKIHWKCWILWTSHFTCKISMNLTYFLREIVMTEFHLLKYNRFHENSIIRVNERIFLWWIIYFAWNMFHTWFHEIFLNDTYWFTKVL